jgi:carboxyvinyl-carboxyphosphonate phosphorylmutase
MERRKVLRKKLNSREKIIVPGAYDAWTAKLIENAEFSAVFITGYGVSASFLGKPDIGLLSFSEMVTVAKNISALVNIPVFADADNGYGGLLNVIRTVQEYEQVGVSAIQLEDQVIPKRCGHMDGKEVISLEDMVAKIKAAIYARKDPNLIIIARTDARGVLGFEEALKRAKAYEAAGADVIFVEAPQSVEELKIVARKVKAPLVSNMVERGKTPLLTAEELHRIGYSLILFPVSTIYCSTKAVQDMLQQLKDEETTSNMLNKFVSFPEFNKNIMLNELRDLEKSLIN